MTALTASLLRHALWRPHILPHAPQAALLSTTPRGFSSARTGPPRLLIVHHSRTGLARDMAAHIAVGARKFAAEDGGLASEDGLRRDKLFFAQSQDTAPTATLLLPNLEIALQACHATQAQDLEDASGYVFVAPENLASMTGAMKEFFDTNVSKKG